MTKYLHNFRWRQSGWSNRKTLIVVAALLACGAGVWYLAANDVGTAGHQVGANNATARGDKMAGGAGRPAGGPADTAGNAAARAANNKPAGAEGKGKPAAGAGRGPGGRFGNGPIPVRVEVATIADLDLQFKTIGTITAQSTVLVQSRVSGQLLKLHFQEGQQVKAGDLLAEIDPIAYQVKLAQAEGQYQQDQAQLQQAQADLALYQKLKAQNSIAQQQINAQQAQVKQLQALSKVHQAQVDAARLELSYTRITAPISGTLGLRKVDAGNLLQANAAAGIVSITQSQPIDVVFSIPEQQLPALQTAVKTQPELLVEAWDRTDKQRLSGGRLTTLDNQIDLNTGTLKLKAEFSNADGQLFPNQFVNVRLQIAKRPGAVTIPQDAVQYGADGSFVYAIEEGKAQLKLLTLGITSGDRIEVLSGLAAGDQVVMEGLDRLRPGRAVQVLNTAKGL